MEKSLENRESDSVLMNSEIKICDKCGDPIEKEILILGKTRRVPVTCSCKRKEIEERRIYEEHIEKGERLKRLFNNSLMDKKFINETFENWDFNKGNKSMYNVGVKYCEKFKEVKKEGLGFILYGKPGNGKTYLSNCIGNRLLNKFVPVICVGINQLLERIRQTYNKYGNEGEDTILRGLALADLLILDDLGAEQLTEWSVSKVYTIIDSRYRNKLPIIISTNKTVSELRDMYGERTIDRVLEMCTPIENKGESIRKNNAKRNTDLLRDILK